MLVVKTPYHERSDATSETVPVDQYVFDASHAESIGDVVEITLRVRHFLIYCRRNQLISEG